MSLSPKKALKRKIELAAATYRVRKDPIGIFMKSVKLGYDYRI